MISKICYLYIVTFHQSVPVQGRPADGEPSSTCGKPPTDHCSGGVDNPKECQLTSRKIMIDHRNINILYTKNMHIHMIIHIYKIYTYPIQLANEVHICHHGTTTPGGVP